MTFTLPNPCAAVRQAYDRIVGFDEFGARDDFNTALLEKRLLATGVVKAPEADEDAEQEHEQARPRAPARAGRSRRLLAPLCLCC